MARTNATKVGAVIDAPSTELFAQAISMATDLVDALVANTPYSSLSSNLQVHLETLLAAHYYSLYDPSYIEKKTGDASGKFRDRDYMKEADALVKVAVGVPINVPKVSLTWLGTKDSEDLNWWERNT